MKTYLFLFLSLLLLSTSAPATDAQTADPAEQLTCDATITELAYVVEQVCTNLGEDQVCYGNSTVNAVPNETVNNFAFEAPGDFADLGGIRSLYLSQLNLEDNEWGIAQMRVLANINAVSPISVTMLLFGDTALDGITDADRAVVPVAVGQEFNARMRSTPSLNALIVDVANTGETVEAVARLEDSSWVRVREAELGRVGWVSADLLDLSTADISVLTVEDGEQPYYNGMQAFSLQTGASGTCGNSINDGLLIQTPQGVARVTFRINEVVIELQDAGSGSTALIDGDASSGMNLSMLDGAARVTVGNTAVDVGTNQRVNIGMDSSMSPTGGISTPSDVSTSSASASISTINAALVPTLQTITMANNPTLAVTTDDDGETGEDGEAGEDSPPEEAREGDFGCDQPGNACNAPGQENNNGNNGNNGNGGGNNGNNG